jgi:hypothetical protein
MYRGEKAGALSRRALALYGIAAVFVFVLLSVPALGKQQHSQIPPSIEPRNVQQLDSASETIGTPYPGLLVIPPGKRHTPDATYGGMYDATCAVYMGEHAAGSATIESYERRFIVHVPTAESLPLAKQVGRMLLLLLGEAREHLHLDNPHAHPTIDVWLTARPRAGGGSDIGGEQRDNQIWIFDIASDRTPVEWAREVSHEYGHFILPGVGGFTDPEEWANGVLGERLFLHWIDADLRAKKVAADDLPFGTPPTIAEYVTRQSDVLIRTIASAGFDERSLARRDRAGMDLYTGLVLYVDAVYGSKMLLSAMSNTSPPEGGVVRAANFYHGFKVALQSAGQVTLHAPVTVEGGGLRAFEAFLPAGEFTLSADDWHVIAERPGAATTSGRTLRVKSDTWVTVRPGSGDLPAVGGPALRLVRAGNG